MLVTENAENWRRKSFQMGIRKQQPINRLKSILCKTTPKVQSPGGFFTRRLNRIYQKLTREMPTLRFNCALGLGFSSIFTFFPGTLVGSLYKLFVGRTPRGGFVCKD